MADLPYWLQLLVYQAPTLLVALVGLILGLVNLRRCPGPALLTLLGCGLFVLTDFFSLVVRAALFEQMRDRAMPAERYAQLMFVVGIAGSLGYALGVLLVVVAVFSGRGAY